LPTLICAKCPASGRGRQNGCAVPVLTRGVARVTANHRRTLCRLLLALVCVAGCSAWGPEPSLETRLFRHRRRSKVTGRRMGICSGSQRDQSITSAPGRPACPRAAQHRPCGARGVGRPGQIGDLREELRLDPMDTRQDERRAEARLARGRDAQGRRLAG
jgi:hypothetical protein